MPKTTIDMPNDVNVIQSNAAMQTIRVAQAMARWFEADVNAVVSDGECMKVISLSFAGDFSKLATEHVGFFMEKGGLGAAFIKPSLASKLDDSNEIKMNLDKIATIPSQIIDDAARDAAYNGRVIANRVNRDEGRIKS